MTSLAIDRALAKFQMSYTFDESKVARDDDGRFASKGGSGGAPSFRTPALREPSPGPTIERRSLTRGESWQRVGSKIGDFPKEYVEEAPGEIQGGRNRVYATREAPADWFKAPPKIDWQVPPDMPVERHIETVGALKRIIAGTRQDAITKARETRQKVAVHGIKDKFTVKRRSGDLILPEDTPAGAANRAYNHAAMLALHDFGVLDYDFQMSDDQKAELTPLIPFMRYTRRRLGAEMRSGDLKGATKPYRAAFGAPFKDERRHKVTGDVRLRVRPNDVLVKRMNCRCAEAVAKNCQASDCPRAIGMAEAEFAALASGADDPGPPDDIEMRLRRLEARQDPDGFAARWSGRPRYITEDELHALASEAADPTPAQAEAGNYRMGHVKIGGLPFAIETPMGRERRGVSPDGEEWSVTMPAHYGYVKGTEGADEDPVDVYLGPLAHEADLHPVFVVDQVDAETGDFDEHKVMLGFATRPEALRTYDAAFSDGRGPERRDTVTRLTFDEFKDWLGEGDTMAPMGKAAPRGCADERVAMMMGDADRILAQAGEKKSSRWRGVTDPDVEALMPEVDRLIGRPRPPETPERRMERSEMIRDPRIPLATVLGKAFDEAKVARDEDGKFASKGGWTAVEAGAAAGGALVAGRYAKDAVTAITGRNALTQRGLIERIGRLKGVPVDEILDESGRNLWRAGMFHQAASGAAGEGDAAASFAAGLNPHDRRRDRINRMTEARANTADPPGTLWRGLHGKGAERFLNLKPGDVASLDAPSSWTRDPSVATHFTRYSYTKGPNPGATFDAPPPDAVRMGDKLSAHVGGPNVDRSTRKVRVVLRGLTPSAKLTDIDSGNLAQEMAGISQKEVILGGGSKIKVDRVRIDKNGDRVIFASLVGQDLKAGVRRGIARRLMRPAFHLGRLAAGARRGALVTLGAGAFLPWWSADGDEAVKKVQSGIPLATVLGKAFDEAKIERDEDGKFTSKGRGRFSDPLYDDLYHADLMLGGTVGAGMGAAAVAGTYAAMNAVKSRGITPAAMARSGKKFARAKMRLAREAAHIELRGRPEELAQAAHRKVMEEARNRGGDMAEAARDAERMAERVRRLKQRSESTQSAAARFQGWLKGQRAALNAMKDMRPKWRADAAAARRSNRVPGGGKAALVGAIAGAAGGAFLTDRSYRHSRYLSGGGNDERSGAVIAGDAFRIVPGAVTGGIAGVSGGWNLAQRFRVMNSPLRVKAPVVAVPIALGSAIGGGLSAYALASERREARRLALEGRA